MKFSADQAMAHVRALDYPRLAGTEGERRASEYASDEFSRYGLAVERQEVIASRAWETRIRPALLLGSSSVMVIGFASLYTEERLYEERRLFADLMLPSLALWLLAFLSWILALEPWGFALITGTLPPRVHSRNIIARRQVGSSSPLVIFLTHLDSPPISWSRTSRFVFGLLMALAGLEFFVLNLARNFETKLILLIFSLACVIAIGIGPRRTLNSPPWRRGHRPVIAAVAIITLMGFPWFLPVTHVFSDPSPLSTLPLLAMAFALAAYLAWEPFPDFGGPGPGDNRSGIAVLLELARTWPGGKPSPVEAWFVASGAGRLRFAGARALASLLDDKRASRPTLIVCLDTPAFGPKLTLWGDRPGLELATKASADLWIPHWTQKAPFGPDHRTFEDRKQGTFCLIENMPDAFHTYGPGFQTTDLDPALVAACGQLATEIAMRWARRQKGEGQDESRDRSSQNPG
jgi:hypothetical protein